MPPREQAALLACATSLGRAAAAGQVQPLLRGKKIGLLCDGGHEDAALFVHAATELGAHVAQVRSSLSEHSTPQDVQHTARLLGKLYDALECQDMPASLVQQVSLWAGVPVFDGVATARHASAGLHHQLASELEGAPPADDCRRFLLQAVLVRAMA